MKSNHKNGKVLQSAAIHERAIKAAMEAGRADACKLRKSDPIVSSHAVALRWNARLTDRQLMSIIPRASRVGAAAAYRLSFQTTQEQLWERWSRKPLSLRAVRDFDRLE